MLGLCPSPGPSPTTTPSFLHQSAHQLNSKLPDISSVADPFRGKTDLDIDPP